MGTAAGTVADEAVVAEVAAPAPAAGDTARAARGGRVEAAGMVAVWGARAVDAAVGRVAALAVVTATAAVAAAEIRRRSRRRGGAQGDPRKGVEPDVVAACRTRPFQKGLCDEKKLDAPASTSLLLPTATISTSLRVLLLAAEAAFCPAGPLARRLARLLLGMGRAAGLLLTNGHVNVVVQLAEIPRRATEAAFRATGPLAGFLALVLRFPGASGRASSRHVFCCVRLCFQPVQNFFHSTKKSEPFSVSSALDTCRERERGGRGGGVERDCPRASE